MADIIELSRRSPTSLSPLEPSVLLQLWDAHAQGWSCLGMTQAGRRCRRALSQGKKEAIAKVLSRLDLSEPEDADLETKLFSDISHECLCRDHDDDETAKTLVEKWRISFQKARAEASVTQEIPSKGPSSTDSKPIERGLNAGTEIQSPRAATRSSPAPAGGSTGKDHENNTQLNSPPLSFRESEEGDPPSPPAERTLPKLDFSAPHPTITPSKSPETSKPTPSFDFTQLFQTPCSQKPTVNPQKSTPAPASFKFAQSKTPGTLSTADRSCSPVSSLSLHENSPSFVFSSSSTPSKPPAELSSFEGRAGKTQQRQSLKSQPSWLKDTGESADETSTFMSMDGDSKDDVKEGVLKETNHDVMGLREGMGKLRLHLQQSRILELTHQGPTEADKSAYTGRESSRQTIESHADSEDEGEASGQDERSRKEGGEKVGSAIDSPYQTPKTAGPGSGAGGQSKFDFVFSSG
ncbi:hypothetical protein QBC40DRAFT_297227 [Triangularia verruculosa]|uniref:Uncharacterized protein n=1 Tax=Triangularia verruculosa TaxID=2587418 RepID=A0AAN7AUI4_9PEZI|nr:hypothetical protein QBC40DRAFT_297227 [Triangularia verruculosa]